MPNQPESPWNIRNRNPWDHRPCSWNRRSNCRTNTPTCHNCHNCRRSCIPCHTIRPSNPCMSWGHRRKCRRLRQGSHPSGRHTFRNRRCSNPSGLRHNNRFHIRRELHTPLGSSLQTGSSTHRESRPPGWARRRLLLQTPCRPTGPEVSRLGGTWMYLSMRQVLRRSECGDDPTRNSSRSLSPCKPGGTPLSITLFAVLFREAGRDSPKRRSLASLENSRKNSASPRGVNAGRKLFSAREFPIRIGRK